MINNFLFYLLMLCLGSLLLIADDKQKAQAVESKNNNAEIKYLPGGDEVKRLVDARKGKTELSKLALSMEPGTWAVLNAEVPKGLWSAPPPSKGLHIGTWSDDGHWDSRTGQFLYFGVREARKFVAFSEEKNEWRAIDFDKKPNAPELLQKYGHQYANNSFDPERSRFFTGFYNYDVQKDEWSSFPTPPTNMFKTSMAFEYFTAMNGLLTLTKDPKGTINLYNEEKKTWINLGKTSLPGYHSMARHNPYLKEVLFAGGNDCKNIFILSKDGVITQKKDFPVNLPSITVRYCQITVDPLSGRYLFLIPRKVYDKDEKLSTPKGLFIEYDSVKDEYRLIDDFSKTPWPFYHIDNPLFAHIPEYGVIMWADRKVHIYKHKVCTGLPLEMYTPYDGSQKVDEKTLKKNE